MKQLQQLAILLVALSLVHLAISEPAGRAQQRRLEQRLQRKATWHKQLREKQELHMLTTNHYHHKPSFNATNPQDIEALVALYNATNGKYWYNNTGWLKGDPCQDRWNGLYCIDGRVLHINLFSNNMTGYLPAALAKADHLQAVVLYLNSISGKIPMEIFSMKWLQILDLDNNRLSGKLPTSISMPNITQLLLYENHLNGTLPMEWNTPQLQTLDVSDNQFSGALPEGLSTLRNLQNLIVSFNQLTGSLPTSYGNIENLIRIWLFDNKFQEAPIPFSWSYMKNMQDFEMDKGVGTIPDWIGKNWTKLQFLLIINGTLKGELPTSICSLTQLLHLQIYTNTLTGELPSCICDLHSLRYLELSDNQFSGSLPPCLGQLQDLELLSLSQNNISGSLPDSIGYLSKLRFIDVSSNEIYGSIPSTFSQLTNIIECLVCYNRLSSFGDGLEAFLNRIKTYGCELYSNPWSCPLPSYVPKVCGAQCSQCNSGGKHDYCSECVADSNCGWCDEGHNCLQGSSSGPSRYFCKQQDWSFGTADLCPETQIIDYVYE